MKVHNTVSGFFEERSKITSKIAFVPTMGSIHEGHISLIEKAKSYGETIIVSIFVNPIQFNSTKDFDTYRRSLEDDKKILQNLGVDILFCPPAEEIYPENFKSYVKVKMLSDVLEGKYRKGNMEGVATVVTKLFNIIQPNYAIFGEKDYQQLLLIKSFVSDLNIPVEIISSKTIRDNEGLALSSRNKNLSVSEKNQATEIINSLYFGIKNLISGEKKSKNIITLIENYLSDFNLIKIEYISIRDLENFEIVDEINSDFVILIAVYVGKIRLIDNIIYRKK